MNYRVDSAGVIWDFFPMPYDPALEEAARMKMFHLLTDKIERDSAGLLDNACDACFLVAPWSAKASVTIFRSRLS